MKSFELYENENLASILVEDSAFAGVKRVAKTVAEDLFLVTDRLQEPVSSFENVAGSKAVFAATYGQSKWTDELEAAGKINVTELKGKRECYRIEVVDNPFSECPQIEKALVIIGSDKRGTIYGLFQLSELCGVSPLVFWGDAAPRKKDEITLDFEHEIQTKEPSVKYRGFFINDEWPAFGKWCTEHYHGVNAKAYDKVFELVLRLKGNYLWPAMWKSSFWEDGPGLGNAKLADEYGVIMGTSHHEPLCRAGVEWQNQFRKYGNDNTWSFVTNSEAITNFWRDGIRRSKGLENVITIGMRGENDSLLMSEDATLQDNINVIKKAIRAQNKLIKEEINENLSEVPRMIAIYKEVEDFYFGAEGLDGLQGFDEIEDAILLLSDDNYGMLRAIPQKDDKPHRGGYGIYYHFDYHGAPFSYEWLGNTSLEKSWEQLTMAYEHDIREMWIVNVGDIKGNEYPLSYFMNLAYDYDQWGVNNINSAAEFTAKWISQQFEAASDDQKEVIHSILKAYTRLTSMRIPESLNAEIYKNNYHEISNMQKMVEEVMTDVKGLRLQLPRELKDTYDSMIYYPVMASLNVIALNLAAGMNHELASRGALEANTWTPKIAERIALDKRYVSHFHRMLNGKWDHMMESAHTGFADWDDKYWSYPQAMTVYPIPYGKIEVSFRGDSAYHLGFHWQDSKLLCNEEMMRPDVDKILLDIDSRGSVEFQYKISSESEWIQFSETEGESYLEKSPRTTIEIRCDREMFTGEQTAKIHIDFIFDNGDSTHSDIEVKASSDTYEKYSGAFLETQDYVCMEASHFDKKVDVKDMGWRVVPRLGRSCDAIKSFPTTKSWDNENERPYVEYKFVVRKSGNYDLAFYMSPRNPMVKYGTLKTAYSVNQESPDEFDCVNSGYFTEWKDKLWNHGVTDNIRVMKKSACLKEGLNTLRIYAVDPNAILEQIVLSHENSPLKETHLAPPESYRIK